VPHDAVWTICDQLVILSNGHLKGKKPSKRSVTRPPDITPKGCHEGAQEEQLCRPYISRAAREHRIGQDRLRDIIRRELGSYGNGSLQQSSGPDDALSEHAKRGKKSACMILLPRLRLYCMRTLTITGAALCFTMISRLVDGAFSSEPGGG